MRRLSDPQHADHNLEVDPTFLLPCRLLDHADVRVCVERCLRWSAGVRRVQVHSRPPNGTAKQMTMVKTMDAMDDAATAGASFGRPPQ